MLRTAVVALAFGLLSSPLGAAAQQPVKVPKIGVLIGAPPATAAPYIEVGRRRLRELGYVEGQNVAVEYRFASGQRDALPRLGAELAALNVDVIVVVGDRAIQAVMRATRTIPIVMVSGGDPVGAGFVASIARPGGNVTGVASLIPELNGKMLALLKETVPRISRIAVLWNPDSLGGVLGFKDMQRIARGLGVSLHSAEVHKADDFDKAFAEMTRERAEAFIVLTDPATFRERARIVEFAATRRLPAMYEIREFVEAGGLMAYGPSLAGMIERSVYYVEKILRGAKPADLPVEQPTKFELVINLKATKALGLAIPQPVLVRADQLLE